MYCVINGHCMVSTGLALNDISLDNIIIIILCITIKLIIILYDIVEY